MSNRVPFYIDPNIIHQQDQCPFCIKPEIGRCQEEVEYDISHNDPKKKLDELLKKSKELVHDDKLRDCIEAGSIMTTEEICDAAKSNPSVVKVPFKITFDTRTPQTDTWKPKEEDMLFKCTEDCIYVPIHVFYKNNVTDNIDYFSLNAKRCYHGIGVRRHIVHYINYFEKFYDQDKQLYVSYAYIKYMIDYADHYTKEDLFNDIFKYVFTPVILNRVKLMVERNYMFNLNNGKKTNNVSLQYADAHAILLLNFSIMQKLTIPLVTHYITIKKYKSKDINDILMQFYYRIFDMFKSIDMISKLYETVMSSVKRSMKKNKLWDMQNIRGINPTTHTIESVENIPLHLSPKYSFNKHLISFNFKSIRRHIGNKILDISYNYTYVPLSSSIRDEDNNSKIDKYEANLEKTDENMHLYIKANKVATIYSLMHCSGFGEITEDEIEFYRKELSKSGDIRNPFQQELVNLSLFKYFGDPITSKFSNQDEYIALMIASKRLMRSQFIIIPEIICGRVVRLVNRKSINKKGMEKIKASPTWVSIQNLFRNPVKEDQVLSYIAVILSSKFSYISYEYPELNGKKIEMQPEIVGEEFLKFILYSASTDNMQFARGPKVIINQE